MGNIEYFVLVLGIVIVVAVNSGCVEGKSMLKSMHLSWGTQRSGFLQPSGRDDVTLLLDTVSGSGIQSKDQFLWGSVEMLIKLVDGDSAGTVTSFYLSSMGEKQDEIDFEFLGNVSGQPYIIHTNIFTQGAGGREVQFYPWFDPAADYHNYTIHWDASHVVWYVDGIPIRVYKNYGDNGIPYLKVRRPMRAYSSIWNADSWATRGGLDKIDWSNAPFVARLRKFRPRACKLGGGRCANATSSSSSSSSSSPLTLRQQNWMALIASRWKVYDYCQDYDRYNGLFPGECFKPHY